MYHPFVGPVMIACPLPSFQANTEITILSQIATSAGDLNYSPGGWVNRTRWRVHSVKESPNKALPDVHLQIPSHEESIDELE